MNKQNNKYVIIFDVDGTLVKSGTKIIPSETLQEIKRIKSLGHITAICTGRSLDSVSKLVGAEHFDYLALLLSNIIKDNRTNEIIYKNEIDGESLKPMINYLIHNNYDWSYKDEFADKTISQNKQFADDFNASLVSIDTLNDDLRNNNIYQLLVNNFIPKNDILRFPNFTFYYMPHNYMDITTSTSKKSNAVEFFRNKYPSHTIVAVGDSVNDIDMLDSADISIAMGNADDEVKSHAKYITKDYDQSGIVHAIKDILKI